MYDIFKRGVTPLLMQFLVFFKHVIFLNRSRNHIWISLSLVLSCVFYKPFKAYHSRIVFD